MTKYLFLAAALVGGLTSQVQAGVIPKGRIVVFADRKEGDFKTDKSIRPGTNESLEGLKLVDIKKGVHACFIGTPENIKPIVDGMIANTNKTDGQNELKLKTFETKSGEYSIQLEITSESGTSPYLQLKIDPC